MKSKVFTCTCTVIHLVICKNFNVFSLFFLLSPFGKVCDPSFAKPWSPFTQGYSVSSLVEISQVVLEKKILNFVNALSLFHHYLPLEKNPLHTRMLRAKFGGNWSSDSREKFKNGKSLKSDRWMDRQTIEDVQQVIRKANLCFHLRWAKNLKCW